jgi:hypothetical protein
MFDGEVALAPPAVEEALAKLPARRGLALLLAEGGRPVLLLPAADLRARVAARLKNPDEQERRRLPDLQAITRTILWRLAPSHFESDLRFLEIARQLWPDTCEEMLAWKPAWFIKVDLWADYPYFTRTQDVALCSTGILPVCNMGVPPLSSSVSSVTSSSPGNADATSVSGRTPAPHRAETAMLHTGKTRTGPYGSPVLRQRYFGPFPGGSAAQRFIDGLADAFHLCRDVRCLRQAPRGRRCSYGQMGKCLCPCDGTIAAADYARVVAEAVEFVAGDRRPLAQRFAAEMKQAAAALQFERAGEIRAKLKRLEELEGPDYAYVAPIEEFRFLLIQRGEGRKEKKLSAFLADCASIRSAGPVEYPLKVEQLQKLVDEAVAKSGTPPYFRDGNRVASPISVNRWAMGLVAHYLFAGPRRRGVIVPIRADLTAEKLAAEIEKSAEALGVKKTPKAVGGG